MEEQTDIVERTVRVNNINLCYFEWRQECHEAETVLLVHATGFHARCWDKVADLLAGKHVIAIDMRGHGRSDNEPVGSWSTYGNDVVEFIKALDLTNIVGVGHSMGGHALVQAAFDEQQRFSRLLLVDPVIMAPEMYSGPVADDHTWMNKEDMHPVAKRKNFFKDADTMFANFKGRGTYGLWREDILRDYCEYGLVPNPEGEGYVLACPPQIEATIYMGSTSVNIYEKIHGIQIPVTLLRAKPREVGSETMDFGSSPTWEQLASEFKTCNDVFLPELTHFIPMQDPGLVARYILEPDH